MLPDCPLCVSEAQGFGVCCSYNAASVLPVSQFDGCSLSSAPQISISVVIFLQGGFGSVLPLRVCRPGVRSTPACTAHGGLSIPIAASCSALCGCFLAWGHREGRSALATNDPVAAVHPFGNFDSDFPVCVINLY